MANRFRPYYFDPVKLMGHEATMRQNSGGAYVLYEDYAKLELALCDVRKIIASDSVEYDDVSNALRIMDEALEGITSSEDGKHG